MTTTNECTALILSCYTMCRNRPHLDPPMPMQKQALSIIESLPDDKHDFNESGNLEKIARE
jgi:hypothetical protein